MAVLVTGATGQLGYDCLQELKKRGITRKGTVRRVPESPDQIQIDLCDYNAVLYALDNVDCVIHCAAWTNVDGAEDPVNYAAVRSANVTATETIAKAAKHLGCKMIYVSTDYVFDGHGTRPWQPDDNNFAPLNVYGQSKLDGEYAVSSILERFFIVRTSWVFGINGKNFIKSMINIGKAHDTVRVINDQIGTPTYTKDLARLLVDMAYSSKYGFYHATNSEEKKNAYISWYDFCCEFYRQYGLSTKVLPVSTQEYGLNVATRPFNSRLDKSKLVEAGFLPLPIWQDAVSRYLKEASF